MSKQRNMESEKGTIKGEFAVFCSYRISEKPISKRKMCQIMLDKCKKIDKKRTRKAKK